MKINKSIIIATTLLSLTTMANAEILSRQNDASIAQDQKSNALSNHVTKRVNGFTLGFNKPASAQFVQGKRPVEQLVNVQDELEKKAMIIAEGFSLGFNSLNITTLKDLKASTEQLVNAQSSHGKQANRTSKGFSIGFE